MLIPNRKPHCLNPLILTAVRCFDNGYVGRQPVAWKENCAEHCLKELQESMDRCTGHHNITEVLLKMALNTIQSINLNPLTNIPTFKHLNSLPHHPDF